MKTLKSSLLALPPVVAGMVVVMLLLGGCGGGGGSPSGPSVLDFSSTTRGAVANSVITRFASMNLFSGSRSRQYDTCPRYIYGDNSVTLDFGSGCHSPEFGGRFRGRVTAGIVGAKYDAYGDLIGFSRIDFRLYNLASLDTGEAYNGTLSLRDIGRDDALGYSVDLTRRAGCDERLTFAGTAVYRQGWFTDYVTLSGDGWYFAPAVGSVSFRMNNLAYEIDGCDYPISGNMTLTAGGQTAVASFDTGSCGIARISIGGSQDIVNLTNIDYNPCRATF